jgi:hypothetical protein
VINELKVKQNDDVWLALFGGTGKNFEKMKLGKFTRCPSTVSNLKPPE